MMKWIPVVALALVVAGCDLFGGDNNAPEFVTTPDTVAIAGTEYVYEAEADDVDDDRVSISVADAPLWLSFEEQGNHLRLFGTPSRREVGVHRIELRATDDDETTVQTYSLHVGYDFAGLYQAAVFTYFDDETSCNTYDALAEGGFFQLDISAFGRFEAIWDPGARAETINGTYTVSGDLVTLKGIDPESSASIWNEAQFRIEPPRLRQISNLTCGARITFERSDKRIDEP